MTKPPRIAKAQGRSAKEISPGDRFTKLVVIEQVKLDGRKGRFWRCMCDCGTDTVVYSGHLRSGTTKACGCLQGLDYNKKHGLSRSPEYRAWENARSRCYNPKNRKYHLYGARGIKMCHEWRFSFEAFIRDMGRRPSAKHSIERNDSNGNYDPGNCRWALAVEQNRNRPGYNRMVNLNGNFITVAEASEITGIKHATILSRLSMGWTDGEALSCVQER